MAMYVPVNREIDCRASTRTRTRASTRTRVHIILPDELVSTYGIG